MSLEIRLIKWKNGMKLQYMQVKIHLNITLQKKSEMMKNMLRKKSKKMQKILNMQVKGLKITGI